jgi:hypothetical protein
MTRPPLRCLLALLLALEAALPADHTPPSFDSIEPPTVRLTADAVEVKELAIRPVKEVAPTFRYGDYVGTFQMVVFLENKEALKAVDTGSQPTEEEQKVWAVAQSAKETDPEKRPESLEAKQEQLKKQTNAAKISLGDKGLLVPGKDTKGEVKKVAFRFYRDPVTSDVIYYYRPGASR